MKYRKLGILTGAVLGICQIVSADALLIDAYDSANPTSISAWSTAGVTEDITDAAVGTIVGNGSIYNISGMTVTKSGNGSWNGSKANGMLVDYWSVQSGTATVSIGGLDTGLTTDTGYIDAGDNTFTIQANQDYKLYLFGIGDVDGQDTTFTFDGLSKTTSSVFDGAEDSHYVSYEFTTGADVSGYTLDFSFSNNSSEYGAWNGLALVSVSSVVPEPVSLGLIGVTGGVLLFIRRRFII